MPRGDKSTERQEKKSGHSTSKSGKKAAPLEEGKSGIDSTFLIHVGGEILVVGAVAFTLWKSIQDLKNKVDPVAKDNVDLAQYISLMEKAHADALIQQRDSLTALAKQAEQHKKDLESLI